MRGCKFPVPQDLFTGSAATWPVHGMPHLLASVASRAELESVDDSLSRLGIGRAVLVYPCPSGRVCNCVKLPIAEGSLSKKRRWGFDPFMSREFGSSIIPMRMTKPLRKGGEAQLRLRIGGSAPLKSNMKCDWRLQCFDQRLSSSSLPFG